MGGTLIKAVMEQDPCGKGSLRKAHRDIWKNKTGSLISWESFKLKKNKWIKDWM